jgi:hypothetical protein
MAPFLVRAATMGCVVERKSSLRLHLPGKGSPTNQSEAFLHSARLAIESFPHDAILCEVVGISSWQDRGLQGASETFSSPETKSG